MKDAKAMNLAVIPARKGSKSLIDKNVLPLMGKPLLGYSIEAAVQSRLFEKVVVSTDSREYAEIAERYGATVPYLRSKKLSEDSIPTSEVTKDVLRYFEKKQEHYKFFAVLQVSSPLRTVTDIKNSYELLIEKKANTVISVCESPVPQPWINELPSDKSMEDFISYEYRNKPRQFLPKYYKIHGAIFWGKAQHYLAHSDPFARGSFAYEMPPERSIDIDTFIDFELAEILYKRMQKQQ